MLVESWVTLWHLIIVGTIVATIYGIVYAISTYIVDREFSGYTDMSKELKNFEDLAHEKIRLLKESSSSDKISKINDKLRISLNKTDKIYFNNFK